MFFTQINSNQLCPEVQEQANEPANESLMDKTAIHIYETRELKQPLRDFTPLKKEVEEYEEQEETSHTSKNINVDSSSSTTPLIPESVYQALPDFFKRATSYYQFNQRQKDVFLTSLITSLSGCPFDISGIYRGKRVYTTLYSFVIAPPASGKGVVADVKYVIQPLHKYLSRSENVQKAMRLLIPGDVSSAMMFKLLYGNDGWGVMIMPEADTYGNGKKQDWSNKDDKARLNWHHESFQIGRKAEDEYFDLEIPRMSMTIAGTPNQVPGVVSNTVDGLFSRFIFYKFDQDMGWDPLKTNLDVIDLGVVLNELGEELVGMFKTYNKLPCTFTFTDEQTTRFNEAFVEHYTTAKEWIGDEGPSIIRRLGLIVFRIAMLFTAFRAVEQGTGQKELFCNDNDLTIALTLADVYLKHSMAVLEIMPENYFEAKDRKIKLLNKLPADFTRKQAIEIAKGICIPKRTVDRYLSDLSDMGKLVSPEHGVYKKK